MVGPLFGHFTLTSITQNGSGLND
uniref:Uncharacterized protein n=1 Tax=Ciona savignyi TaxID=51511 RepID=H2YRU9_CIOSA